MKTNLFASKERHRIEARASLDAPRSQAERNRMGQFATPFPLALEILSYAKKLLPADHKIRFFDPGFGTGAFYSALLQTFPLSSIASATGYEIDTHYGDPARQLWGGTGLNLRISDFTKASPPKEGFDLVICNPPYVRHHHILNGEKTRLQIASRRACGVQFGGLAGLYCHFLGLSHAWMVDGGIAGWLIPSEFMDVNYGAAVKHYLLDKVRLSYSQI
jgi:methylase of polypeptide subunit release factors